MRGMRRYTHMRQRISIGGVVYDVLLTHTHETAHLNDWLHTTLIESLPPADWRARFRH